MDTWKFNKGEWAEAYVFLYILGNGRLYGAKSDLTKDETSYIDVLKIIRDEVNSCREYERKNIDGEIKVIAYEGEEEFLILTTDDLKEQAATLYTQLKNNVGQKGAIAIPSAQNFLQSMKVDTPKANLSSAAKKVYGAKTDIIIQSEDSRDHFRKTDGFSIKSYIGSNPTLFNASQTSGFRYKVSGCTKEIMHKVNFKDDFLAMVDEIKVQHCKLIYEGCRNTIFEGNINLEDSNMDLILQNAVLVFIGYYSGHARVNNVADICDVLAMINPLSNSRPAAFYRKRVVEFLLDSFAGMTASREWDGRRTLTGGFIDVSKDGSMLFYRAISDDVFCNYLYENTTFDRPDRGRNKNIAVAKAKAYFDNRELSEEDLDELNNKALKCDFGYIYEVGDDFYFDVNFQIRFKK